MIDLLSRRYVISPRCSNRKFGRDELLLIRTRSTPCDILTAYKTRMSRSASLPALGLLRQFLYEFRHFCYPVKSLDRLDFPVMCPLNHNQKSRFLTDERAGLPASFR